MKQYPTLKTLPLLGVLALPITPSWGAWTVVENYENKELGTQRPEVPVDGANYVPTYVQRVEAPHFADVFTEDEMGLDEIVDPDNKIFNFYLDSLGGQYDVRGGTSYPLPSPVNPGEVITVYMRMYMTGPTVNLSVGMTDKNRVIVDGSPYIVLNPSQWGDFESQIAINAGTFRPRDPLIGSPNIVTTEEFPINQWWEIYLVVDNANFRTQFYYRDAAAIAAGDAPTVLPVPRSDGNEDNWYYFRNYAPGLTATDFIGEVDSQSGMRDGTLKSVYLFMAAMGNTDFTFVDDIYVDMDGVNLTSPFDDSPPAETWGPYDIVVVDGVKWVDTGDWLGWLALMQGGHEGPEWLYSLEFDEFIYFAKAPLAGESGVWGYLLRTPRTPDTTAGETWGDYEVVDGDGRWVDTGDWIGLLALLQNGGNGPEWVYSLLSDAYFYFSKPPANSETGVWVYLLK